MIKNRTIFTGDNLHILRGIDSESIDLIYLDPPFNSNRHYSAPIGSEAAGAEFKDAWTFEDTDAAWWGELAEEHPALYEILEGAGAVGGEGNMAYLIYMAVRLLELRRVLRPTGSIYLHCDPTMSHSLKLVMDAVFGPRNFLNEIVWKRTSSHNNARRWGPIHDVIFLYANGPDYIWNKIYQDYDQEYIDRFYRHHDERGRYRLSDLTGAGTVRNGDSGKSWRGFDPTEKGRHWGIPRTLMERLVKTEELEQLTIQQRLDILEQNGYIDWPKRNGLPQLKRYLADQLGVPLQDIITDISPVSSRTKERIGYPTQKPITLLQRIIIASSNENDTILDPFCGCATTCIAAEFLQRAWIGIDISPLAAELVVGRAEREIGGLFKIIHRTDIPTRDAPPRSRDIKHVLFGQQEGRCNGCMVHFRFSNFALDHIIPRAHGGPDTDDNLQLLCAHCNSVKGDRPMEYLLARKHPQHMK